MISLDLNKKHENDFFHKISYKTEDITEQEVFQIDDFILNVTNFNSAVENGNISSIIKSTNNLHDQLFQCQDSNSDPEIPEETDFNYSLFYSNCIKCFNLYWDELNLKIINILEYLSRLSTDIGDTFITNDFLNTLLDIFINANLSSEVTLAFLNFIDRASLNSWEVRIVMAQSGILNFFSSVLQSHPNSQVYIENLKCIDAFFSYEDFEEITKSPHFDQLLINLGQIINKIFLKQLDLDFDEITYVQICKYIISIFNAYIGAKNNNYLANRNVTCSHFLNLDIPSSFLVFFEIELPKDINDALICPIILNIIELLLFGENNLVQALSSRLDILWFVNLLEYEDSKICSKIMNIIDILIDICPDNILKLFEIDFYNNIIISLENADFQIKTQIICIIVTTILNSTSSEMVQYFTNENVVNYLIEFIDISDNPKLNFIPNALLKINELISPDDQLFYTISQTLENISFSNFE